MSGDRAVPPDRLEHVEICDGSSEIGEVSLTLQMPFYPVAYGVGICLLYPVPGVRVRYHKNHWRRNTNV